LLLHAAVQQSIDISCPPGPQQQTRRTLLQRSTAGTDRWKDGRTPYRYTDPAAYYKREVSINSLQPQTFVALLAAYVALVAERVEGGLGNTTAGSQAWLALCTQRLHTASGHNGTYSHRQQQLQHDQLRWKGQEREFMCSAPTVHDARKHEALSCRRDVRTQTTASVLRRRS